MTYGDRSYCGDKVSDLSFAVQWSCWIVWCGLDVKVFNFCVLWHGCYAVVKRWRRYGYRSKKGVTMINREDIKKGLKFRMPNDIIRRKYQVASFRGATDMCESIQYLTTLKTPHGDKNYVTPKVPLFEVCVGPKLISFADKKDPYCAWVGEYIKVRSDALGKKPLYISLYDVMQHGRTLISTLFSVRRTRRTTGRTTPFLPAVVAAVKDSVWSITDLPLTQLAFLQSLPRHYQRHVRHLQG